MTSASSGGLRLDPADPVDRPIIARQVKVARQAGREGRDRAAVTRGRADLEAAYDEGAAEAATDQAQPTKAATDETSKPSPPGRGRRTWDQFQRMGPGWQSVKPASPAKPPTRAADAGGFLAGLALYAVVVIYVRYGPEGWKGWLSAKFLNKPLDATGATGATGTKPKNSRGGARAV